MKNLNSQSAADTAPQTSWQSSLALLRPSHEADVLEGEDMKSWWNKLRLAEWVDHHLAFRSCSKSVLYCQRLRHVAQAVDECLDYRVYRSALQSDDGNCPGRDRKIDRQ
jgi:hypothetical protein